MSPFDSNRYKIKDAELDSELFREKSFEDKIFLFASILFSLLFHCRQKQTRIYLCYYLISETLLIRILITRNCNSLLTKLLKICISRWAYIHTYTYIAMVFFFLSRTGNISSKKQSEVGHAWQIICCHNELKQGFTRLDALLLPNSDTQSTWTVDQVFLLRHHL